MLDQVIDEWIETNCRNQEEEDTARKGIDANLARIRREAKAEALREAAAEWTQGDWAGATRYHNRAADRLASAQYAGDWLRARADRIEAGE